MMHYLGFWLTIITGVILWFAPENKYNYLQVLFLALTLIALLVYTHQTWLMQKAVSLQTKFAILPVFIPDVVEHSQPEVGRWLELQNIGNGTALNVQIDPINIDFSLESPTLIPDPYLMFERVIQIKPSEKSWIKTASFRSTEDKKPLSKLDWLLHLTPAFAQRDYEMIVRFNDILGNKYHQLIHIGSSGCWPGPVVEDK